MADYTTRVEEIAALVRAVDGSGLVHARNRNTANWGQFILFFRDEQSRINGWQISRKAPAGTKDRRWEETYQLVKLYGIRDADASDFTFQTNLDDVGRVFVAGRDLTFGSVAEGFRIIAIEERVFGAVVCHVADCEITVSLYTQDL